MVQFTCPSCAQSFRTADANAGKTTKCPNCGSQVTIPGPAPAAPATYAAVAPSPAPAAARKTGQATFGDYLTFRAMITPILVQIVFWLGVLGCVIGGIVMAVTASPIVGIPIVIFGPLAVRVYCELLIVLFMIQDGIRRIAAGTAR